MINKDNANKLMLAISICGFFLAGGYLLHIPTRIIGWLLFVIGMVAVVYDSAKARRKKRK